MRSGSLPPAPAARSSTGRVTVVAGARHTSAPPAEARQLRPEAPTAVRSMSGGGTSAASSAQPTASQADEQPTRILHAAARPRLASSRRAWRTSPCSVVIAGRRTVAADALNHGFFTVGSRSSSNAPARPPEASRATKRGGAGSWRSTSLAARRGTSPTTCKASEASSARAPVARSFRVLRSLGPRLSKARAPQGPSRPRRQRRPTTRSVPHAAAAPQRSRTKALPPEPPTRGGSVMWTRSETCASRSDESDAASCASAKARSSRRKTSSSPSAKSAPSRPPWSRGAISLPAKSTPTASVQTRWTSHSSTGTARLFRKTTSTSTASARATARGQTSSLAARVEDAPAAPLRRFGAIMIAVVAAAAAVGAARPADGWTSKTAAAQLCVRSSPSKPSQASSARHSASRRAARSSVAEGAA
mmetsp:Transcript_15008/g.52249  ORF Transcript_15008/g.52249 Transcript_15008/m.52249 type:complete len:418 (+) Transcript_15008:263-1516(+)